MIRHLITLASVVLLRKIHDTNLSSEQHFAHKQTNVLIYFINYFFRDGQKALNDYDLQFKKYYHELMMKKLGINTADMHDKDQKLISNILDLLEQTRSTTQTSLETCLKCMKQKKTKWI